MAGWVVLAIQMVSHPPRGIRRDNLRVSRGVQDRRYRVRRGVVCGAVDHRVRVGRWRRLAHGGDQAGRGAWFPRTAAGGPRQWCVRARTLSLLRYLPISRKWIR